MCDTAPFSCQRRNEAMCLIRGLKCRKANACPRLHAAAVALLTTSTAEDLAAPRVLSFPRRPRRPACLALSTHMSAPLAQHTGKSPTKTKPCVTPCPSWPPSCLPRPSSTPRYIFPPNECAAAPGKSPPRFLTYSFCHVPPPRFTGRCVCLRQPSPLHGRRDYGAQRLEPRGT